MFNHMLARSSACSTDGVAATFVLIPNILKVIDTAAENSPNKSINAGFLTDV